MPSMSERVRRDAEQRPPKPSDSGVFAAPMGRSGHGAEDAHARASRHAPGLAKAGGGRPLTARERAAIVWAQAHEATGTSSATTARALGIQGDRDVRRFGDPASGKIANLAHAIEAPSAVRAHIGEQLLASTVEVPSDRTEEDQIDRVTNAVLSLRTARDDAARERAIATLGREHRILRALRAGRCP